MNEITVIYSNEIKKWNECVRSFHNYDVFYLCEYSLAFKNENEKNGEPILLYYENQNDRAINVVFCRDIAMDDKMNGKIEQGKFYDLISPYGYGGFIGDISDYERLNAVYNQFCIDNGFICEFVRFNLFSDYCSHYDGQVESRTHNIVRSLNAPVSEIWMDFKQKVRKNVKRANEEGLEIIIDNTDSRLDDFLRIYYSTMERNAAEHSFYFSKQFFETLCKMNNNFTFFYTAQQGKIISTELVIYGGENCYSYLGGTDSSYFALRPNDFLKYEVIKWAQEIGLNNFVLGGGYGSDDGIFQYKKSFAPNGVVDFNIGRKIFDLDKYKKLEAIRENIPDNGFFPSYRA